MLSLTAIIDDHLTLVVRSLICLFYLPILCNQVAWYGHPDTTGVNTIDYYLTSDVESPSVLAVQGRGFYSEQLVALRGLGTSFTHNYLEYMNATTGAESTTCGGIGSDASDGDGIGGGSCENPHSQPQDDTLSNNPPSPLPASHHPSLSWFATTSFIRALHRNTTGKWTMKQYIL